MDYSVKRQEWKNIIKFISICTLSNGLKIQKNETNINRNQSKMSRTATN